MRCQVAVEWLIALALFSAYLVLPANYYFSLRNDALSTKLQLSAALSEAADLANVACIGLNITTTLRCPSAGNYSLIASGGLLNLTSLVLNASRAIICNMSGGIVGCGFNVCLTNATLSLGACQ